MIIWKGWGILVVIITVLALVVVQGAAAALSGDPAFVKLHHWVSGLALVMAGVPIYFTGFKLNNTEGQILIDKRTGREVLFRRQHSLFFIPMQHWAFIVGIVGLALSIASLVTGN